MADLWRDYRVDLRAMFRGELRPGLVAAFAEHLAPGGAVGQELGGASAVSPEWLAIAGHNLDLRRLMWSMGGRKGPPPQLWPLPEGKWERQEREAREEAKKQAWLRGRERRQKLRDQGSLRLRDV